MTVPEDLPLLPTIHTLSTTPASPPTAAYSPTSSYIHPDTAQRQGSHKRLRPLTSVPAPMLPPVHSQSSSPAGNSNGNSSNSNRPAPPRTSLLSTWLSATASSSSSSHHGGDNSHRHHQQRQHRQEQQQHQQEQQQQRRETTTRTSERNTSNPWAHLMNPSHHQVRQGEGEAGSNHQEAINVNAMQDQQAMDIDRERDHDHYQPHSQPQQQHPHQHYDYRYHHHHHQHQQHLDRYHHQHLPHDHHHPYGQHGQSYSRDHSHTASTSASASPSFPRSHFHIRNEFHVQDPEYDHHDHDLNHASSPSQPTDQSPVATTPEKRKRGRKPKAKPDQDQVGGEGEVTTATSSKPIKKSKPPKEPKASKEPKVPKEKKAKEPKSPKPVKGTKKAKGAQVGGGGSLDQDGGQDGGKVKAGKKTDRSILSFFDKAVGSSTITRAVASTTTAGEEYRSDGSGSSVASPTKSTYKQSCLSFDKLDPSKASTYFADMAAASREDDTSRRFGGLMKELPKLTGRAPYEDLMTGMIMRSSRLPTLNKLNLQHVDSASSFLGSGQELDMNMSMDMLADVKMVHEFLNTFGISLGLTQDSGEWITYELLLSMIGSSRIDSRLLDLTCRMVQAAYGNNPADDGKNDDSNNIDRDDPSSPSSSPKINQFNFVYFLAAGPEARSTLEEKKEDKKIHKYLASSYRKKIVPLHRLGTIEYSKYTISDRIEALVKAQHDILASNRFHRFMRDQVEENITALKRQRRKRAEVRKELEQQIQDLERGMKQIEQEAADLELKRQAILASERESHQENGAAIGGGEEELVTDKRITASSRLQRLAQAKGAKSRATELLNQQKSLANELKIKEAAWETKKDELNDIFVDDSELQKDHNIPLTQLRGGQVVNLDEKLRVICLGSDRWGRKYWFWREFGGVIVEDRAQVGPKVEEVDTLLKKDDRNDNDVKKEGEGRVVDHRSDSVQLQDVEEMEMQEGASKKNATSSTMDLDDVTERMKIMAVPELAGDKFQTTRDRMSINNLLSNKTPPSENRATFVELPKQEPPQQLSELHDTANASTTAGSTMESDLLDYGPIQTWSLISTSKELASITRALNAKGARERVLKASLMTMRKEIEASFSRIKTWAGHQYALTSRNEHATVSVMGAVGQPLTEEGLMLLKKKRGRKSKQELADIAATEMEMEAAGAIAAEEDDKSMEVDHSQRSEIGEDREQDVDMEKNGSNHGEQPHQGSHSETVGEASPAVITPAVVEGFLAAIRGSDSGQLPSEYLESMVRAAEEKLKELSKAICDNDDEVAILNAVNKVRSMDEYRQDEQLRIIVRVLEHCLRTMDESEEEEEEDEGNTEDTKNVKVVPKEVTAMDEDDLNDQQRVNGSATPDDEASSLSVPAKLPIAIPVSVNPRLLTWLETCKIDVMLKDVRTFGALHAWLDECLAAVGSVVYQSDDEDDDENKEGNDDEMTVDRRRNKAQEEEDGAEDEEQEEEDDENEDDNEDEHEEEEGEDADNEKTQEDQYDDEEKEEEAQRASRQRKTRSELRITTIRGRALRARNNMPVSYKDSLKDVEGDEEDDDSEDEELEHTEEDHPSKEGQQREGEDDDEGIATRLRRSRRPRH
ncbi:hypothetical protein EDD11_004271 [Mortierella claussenii]|nr:hypothetical protein EDD11_004271 [Mortierella claussenii]